MSFILKNVLFCFKVYIAYVSCFWSVWKSITCMLSFALLSHSSYKSDSQQYSHLTSLHFTPRQYKVLYSLSWHFPAILWNYITLCPSILMSPLYLSACQPYILSPMHPVIDTPLYFCNPLSLQSMTTLLHYPIIPKTSNLFTAPSLHPLPCHPLYQSFTSFYLSIFTDSV